MADLVLFMMSPKFFKCEVDQKFNCEGGIIKGVRNSVLELHLDFPAYVIFMHNLKEAVICSGLSFQTHVWGGNKYTIWALPLGTSYCAVFKDVFLDECADGLFVVSKFPQACSEVLLSACEKTLLNIMREIGLPLFISLVDSTHCQPFLSNVLDHNSENDCHKRVQTLRPLVV